jgi:Family of unknown function (DUF5670)
MWPAVSLIIKETFTLRDFAFLALAAFFFVIWLVAWLAFHLAGAIVHVLLVFALVLVVIHFVMRTRTT